MTEQSTTQLMDAAKVDCMERGCRCDVLVVATQEPVGVWEIACHHEPFCVLCTPADVGTRERIFAEWD